MAHRHLAQCRIGAGLGGHVHVLIACLQVMSKLGLGIQAILPLLQLSLFERRDLVGLLRGDPPEPTISPFQARIRFA